ncbi:Rpn family recombination-promoting nuclease/putative transposase [Candidatus Chloroploca mongolica]|uniref:Rpn family recombination-promoting nuclease/putative transposase n=1 Tax=Candidatus Chloroploca mongolica TaxID=2528176 RepID=UPI002111555C|nr:Rpn family recombination-promoting nuclease/putative transposase [Candidatus Chloroploca mongolica]
MLYSSYQPAARSHHASDYPASSRHLYLLFEHQSTPDPWMRLRLLNYMCRIWDESFKAAPQQTQLRPIIPMVFYQGRRAWSYSTNLADLFPEVPGWDATLTPHVRHYLIDQSGMPPSAVKGGLKGQITQLLLMAAMRAQAQAVLAAAMPLLAELLASGRGETHQTFFLYLFATQERAVVMELLETVVQQHTQLGGELMTYAEELIEEGLQKGEIKGEIRGELKGKVELIEQLLAAGTTWQVITQATGLTPTTFAELKAELERLMATTPSAHPAPDVAEQG